MNTDARRKASAAFHAKRVADGLKKVTLWLSPEARERLDQLKAEHGSKDKAAEAAILALGRSGPKASKTPPAAKPEAVATPSVQLGPRTYQPGSRLKKR